MRWETPSFIDIKMDAEIGGYQDDFDDPPDVTSIHEVTANSHDESKTS